VEDTLAISASAADDTPGVSTGGGRVADGDDRVADGAAPPISATSVTPAIQAVVPHTRTDDLLGQAADWATLPDDEIKRRATVAAHTHDRAALWSLTEAYLTLRGRAGATLSPHTGEH